MTDEETPITSDPQPDPDLAPDANEPGDAEPPADLELCCTHPDDIVPDEVDQPDPEVSS